MCEREVLLLYCQKKKKTQSLFSLKNKKVTKVQEKGNKQLFAQGWLCVVAEFALLQYKKN